MARFGKEVLRSEDGALSPQGHHQWALHLWRRIDRDNNGSITREELDCEEFRCVVRAVLTPMTGHCMGGPRYARAQMNTDQAVTYCLRKADLNRNGSLSFNEFKALMRVLRQPSMGFTAYMVFALFDLDGDNAINEPEFREIYRFYTGTAPTETEFQAEWAKLDAGFVGKVSLGDYITWLRESANPIFKQHAVAENTIGQDSNSASLDCATTSDASPLRGKASTDVGWRPWHATSNLCWEQRLNPPRQGPAGARLSTAQAKDLAVRRDRPEQLGKTSPEAMQSLLSCSLSSSLTMSRLPKWNPYLSAANPNWINDSANDQGNPRQHRTRRKYFSRPQSLSELQRYYETRPGFHDLRERASQPELKRKPTAFSTDRLDLAPEDLCPNRARPAGCMRHPITGERRKWDNFWQTPTQLKSLYQPSTISYRCPGPPARHLYVDTYDDEA